MAQSLSGLRHSFFVSISGISNSDFAENLELLQPSNPRHGATAWADEGVRPSIKLLLVKHSFYERWSGFPMRFQFDCGRRISNSRVGFGSSPGTYAAKLRARLTASQAGPDWFKAKYWYFNFTGIALGGLVR
jgi:hypothetical protein